VQLVGAEKETDDSPCYVAIQCRLSRVRYGAVCAANYVGVKWILLTSGGRSRHEPCPCGKQAALSTAASSTSLERIEFNLHSFNREISTACTRGTLTCVHLNLNTDAN